MKKLTFLFILTTALMFSFQKMDQPNQQPEKMKHLEVKITGMTCEMGCARTIEAKISKLPGVKYSKVDFAASLGHFSYDPKITNSKTIIDKINGIGGGGVYKVVDSQEVKKFKEKS